MVSTRQSSNMGNGGGSGPVGEVGEAASLRKHHSVTTAGTSSGTTAESPPVRNLNLLDLPVEILEKIFGYLGYNKVAHMRPVSSRSRLESRLVYPRSTILPKAVNLVCRFAINWIVSAGRC